MPAVITTFPTTAKARLTAAAIWLAGVAGAHAEPADVVLRLTPTEIVAIILSTDRQPMSEAPPAGFWDAQSKILEALKANPEAWRKVKAALERQYPVR
jgi:hypothetical protein